MRICPRPSRRPNSNPARGYGCAVARRCRDDPYGLPLRDHLGLQLSGRVLQPFHRPGELRVHHRQSLSSLHAGHGVHL